VEWGETGGAGGEGGTGRRAAPAVSPAPAVTGPTRTGMEGRRLSKFASTRFGWRGGFKLLLWSRGSLDAGDKEMRAVLEEMASAAAQQAWGSMNQVGMRVTKEEVGPRRGRRSPPSVME
jgi:hypothetical protein